MMRGIAFWRRKWMWLALPITIASAFYLWTVTNGLGLVNMQHGYGYYNFLTDAFSKRQLSFLTLPPPQLLALKDPYDPTENERYAMHDASLYKGKYYLYFGATPAVILFWPYRLLHIGYMPNEIAVLIFSLGGLIAGTILLLVLCKHYGLTPPLWIVSIAILNLSVCSVVPFILRRASIYETAISCAYFCLFVSLCFGMVGLWDAGKSKPWALFLSSLFFGLLIGSRPNHIASVVALVLATGILVSRSTSFHDKSLILSISTLWIPLVALLLLIGSYNHLRFGSAFEFGNKYQLASTDVRLLPRWHLNLLLPGLYYYGLQPYHVMREFPFFRLQASYPGTLPKGYIDPAISDGVAGFLWTCPFVLWLLVGLYGLFVRQTLGGRKFLVAVCPVAVFLTCLALIQIIIISLAMPAANMRYEVDFVPLLLIASTLIWFALIQEVSFHRFQKALVMGAGVLMISYGTLVHTGLSICGCCNTFYIQNPSSYLRMKHAFDTTADELIAQLTRHPQFPGPGPALR